MKIAPFFFLLIILGLNISSLPAQEISNSADDEFEEGETTEKQRSQLTWAGRISADGNFIEANTANFNYTQQFNADSKPDCRNNKPLVAAWKQLGPAGNNTNTPTVGQIHRITFHPGYNGKSNKVIFACSGFGGLWKSDDAGDNWQIMNTDNTLPFCGVSDVAVNTKNEVYVATGYADGTIYGSVQPNVSSVNPMFTQGIYVSADDGESWRPVNAGLMDHFAKGGVIRRLLTDAKNGSRLVMASSAGVFYFTSGQWKPGLLNGKKIDDSQLRGLEFKPGSSDTLYASGQNIYRSTDGGSTWEIITGADKGLDFRYLKGQYNDFIPERSNLAVTSLDRNMVYAYIMGREPEKNITRMFLYRFDGSQWEMITTHLSIGNMDLYSQSYMAIAVDPNDPQKIFWGNTIIHTTSADLKRPSQVNQFMSYSVSNGMYVDIHTLIFEPVTDVESRMFVANHGGVSVCTVSQKKWEYKNSGLCNATIWSFDDNETDPDDIIVALQDHGIRTHQEIDGINRWKILNTGGDGYSARIYDDLNKKAYHSNSHATVFEFDFNTIKNTNAYNGFPTDAADPESKPNVFFSKSFPCELDPLTHEPYLGFSEVYKRINNNLYDKNVWQQESDLGKSIVPKWKRQITEMAIAPTDPDRVYLVTMGVDNGTNPEAEWHLDPHFFRSDNGFSNGNWQSNHFKELILSADGSGIPLYKGNVKLPPVTGIAVDPLNENRLWITFTGYSPDHKVYRSDDGGITWVNQDPTSCLHNLPVNGIAYQQGSNDRIYIATDAGVYTKDKDSDWVEYGDLPNVRVVEIKINYCNNSIKAATFGRGVFETTLLPTNNLSPAVYIRNSTTWENDRFVNGDLVILKGSTLTIKGKLHMPAKGRITIGKKGRLIIDGGVITNACGNKWSGVYLQDRRSDCCFLNEGQLEMVESKTPILIQK